jgi:uncharacterized cupin superfamily protein
VKKNMSTVLTQAYGKPMPGEFIAKYQHKFFCNIVQGDVSNVVRQENSVAVTAGTVIPTGTIAYIDDKGLGVAGIKASTATEAVIPQIAIVGTEHGNVYSEKGNSGCGLITLVPLTQGKTIMTTVFDSAATYKVGTLLTAKELDGVWGVAPAAEGDVVVGIVRATPDKTHYGVKGIIFDANFIPGKAVNA